jgi:hypothetical protein
MLTGRLNTTPGLLLTVADQNEARAFLEAVAGKRKRTVQDKLIEQARLAGLTVTRTPRSGIDREGHEFRFGGLDFEGPGGSVPQMDFREGNQGAAARALWALGPVA